MTRYIVTARLVVAKCDSEAGEGYFHKGALLPESPTPEVLANHAWLAERGLVFAFEVPQQPATVGLITVCSVASTSPPEMGPMGGESRPFGLSDLPSAAEHASTQEDLTHG